jgi:hypothetical protein
MKGRWCCADAVDRVMERNLRRVGAAITIAPGSDNSLATVRPLRQANVPELDR